MGASATALGGGSVTVRGGRRPAHVAPPLVTITMPAAIKPSSGKRETDQRGRRAARGLGRLGRLIAWS